MNLLFNNTSYDKFLVFKTSTYPHLKFLSKYEVYFDLINGTPTPFYPLKTINLSNVELFAYNYDYGN